MEDHIDGKRMIAGTNCYFDYSKFEEFKRKQDALAQPPANVNVNVNASANVNAETAKTSKKKKKKKNKNRSGESAANATATGATESRFSVADATLADPSADYPESRVIKMGPNGDLVVESLEDEYPRKSGTSVSAAAAAGDAPRTMVPPVSQIPTPIAEKILAFDPEQRAYWETLSAAAQKQMFTIDAGVVAASMRQHQKDLASRNMQADGAPGSHHSYSYNYNYSHGHGTEHSWSSNPRCYCPRCERNDLHIVNLIEEGFDTYMDELLDGLWEQFELQQHGKPNSNSNSNANPKSKSGTGAAPATATASSRAQAPFVDVASAEAAVHDKYVDAQNLQRFAEIKQIESAGNNAGEMRSTVRNLELFYYIENILAPSLQRGYSSLPNAYRLSSRQRQFQVDTLSCVHQVLCLIQRINDRHRLLRDTKGVGVQPLEPDEFQRMVVADNLIKCLHNFIKEGLAGIPKAVEFVKILATVGRTGEHSFPDVTEQMAKFAEMFENGDGKSFIEVIARLKAAEADPDADADADADAEAEMDVDVQAEAEANANGDYDDEEDPELEHYALKNPFSHCKCEFHTQLSEQFESARSKALQDERSRQQQYSDEEDDLDDHDHDHDCDYDDHDEDCHDCHDCHDHDHLSDEDVDSAAEEEEAEERRFKELRGFFFMEVRKIIVKRFEESYKKRVSEDRTRKFIEELEAEENAKKEKELRKLKSKEKQLEKKRLQQLEKEERRKQKEAEDEAKAALLRQKQEELRAEQKRREDEIRMKKEREKMKKIEALRQKEQASLESKLKAQKAAEEEEKEREKEREKEKEKEREKEKEKEKARALAQAVNKEKQTGNSQEASKTTKKAASSEGHATAKAKAADAPKAVPESKKKTAEERQSNKENKQTKQPAIPTTKVATNGPANAPFNAAPSKSAASLNAKQQAGSEDKKNPGRSAPKNIAQAKTLAGDVLKSDTTNAHAPVANQQVTPSASTTPRKSNNISARNDADVSPKQVEPALDAKRAVPEADVGAAFLPPKNHLLEQLYHARPKTVSTSGESLDFFNEQAAASRMGTGYSPSKKSLSAYQPDTWNLGNGSQFQSESILPPTLDRPQFLNNVAGNASTWSVRNQSDGFHGAPVASPLMSNLPTSTMWSTNYPSRGNSIWGSNPVVNPESNKSSIWGPQAPQVETKKGSFVSNSKELVQAAAFKAIQEVRGAKEMNDGVSSAMRIFQGAKAILNDSNLKMSEFLSALHSSTKYSFEIVYDDFGSVTDIRASLQPERIFGSSTIANRSPSPQQAFIPAQFQTQAPFGQLDTGIQYPAFAPNTLPMNQAMGQPPFQPNLNNPANGAFQPPLGTNSHFSQTPVVPAQQMPAGENPNFHPSSFRGSTENVGPLDSKISETMQGSLNQLGIGQVRGGIW